MSLISKLKSLVPGSSSQDGGGAMVTVEPEPRTETERAVKETPPPAEPAEADEPAAEPSEVDDDSSVADEPTAVDEPTAEDDSTAEPAEDDASGSPSADDASGDEPAAAEVNDDPVDTISGIGPAYASRLGEAGVETVGDLLAADVSALAAETDLGEGQLAKWVAQAEDA